MSWPLLIIAGLLEIVWAAALPHTEGFTRPGPIVVVLLGLAGSMVLLGLAVRELPIGTAYAVWVGIGVAGTAIAGAYAGEPITAGRLVCLAMVLGGLVGLKVTGQH